MCEDIQPKMDEYLKGLREKIREKDSPAAEEPEEGPRGGRSLLEDLTWRLADQQDGQTKIETRLPKWAEKKADMVNHPPHYTSHPSGVECIQITEHMNFCLGNAVKYIWRADLKGSGVEDLKKAAWYIEREIKRRESK